MEVIFCFLKQQLRLEAICKRRFTYFIDGYVNYSHILLLTIILFIWLVYKAVNIPYWEMKAIDKDSIIHLGKVFLGVPGWLSQLCSTLGFGSGCNLSIVRLSPASGLSWLSGRCTYLGQTSGPPSWCCPSLRPNGRSHCVPPGPSLRSSKGPLNLPWAFA